MSTFSFGANPVTPVSGGDGGDEPPKDAKDKFIEQLQEKVYALKLDNKTLKKNMTLMEIKLSQTEELLESQTAPTVHSQIQV